MKLLLTSSGLVNKSIIDTFRSLQNKALSELRVSFIITAALVEPGDKRWLYNDLHDLYSVGVGEIDIIDIASLPKDKLFARLAWADCLFVSGGNTAYLMHWYEKTGLDAELPKLLKTRTYVGVSAGSMVAGYRMPLELSSQVYPEDTHNTYSAKHFLQWQDLVFVPHFGAERLDSLNDDFLQELKNQAARPVYALDDGSALGIVDGVIKVVSETKKWKAL